MSTEPTPTEMEERVARAIATVNDREDRWWEFVGEARAAIRAMREVTKEMSYAGDTAADDAMDSDYSSNADGGSYRYLRSDGPTKIWQAMLDAASPPREP